mmetsp:Transcript_67504/g.162010  ORF Transcript_67504/g.162010 Transcript_67504/m.162010 type:complete len:216 (-) Transcript_67504:1834-2481(-)
MHLSKSTLAYMSGHPFRSARHTASASDLAVFASAGCSAVDAVCHSGPSSLGNSSCSVANAAALLSPIKAVQSSTVGHKLEPEETKDASVDDASTVSACSLSNGLCNTWCCKPETSRIFTRASTWTLRSMTSTSSETKSTTDCRRKSFGFCSLCSSMLRAAALPGTSCTDVSLRLGALCLKKVTTGFSLSSACWTRPAVMPTQYFTLVRRRLAKTE